MKKTSLLLTLLIVFIAFVSNAQITNGGFESWTAANPDGWGGTKTHTTGLTIHKVTATDSVHSGVNACGLKNTYTAHRRFTSVPTSVTNGTSYEISFWVKGTGQVRTSMFTGAANAGYGYLTYNAYVSATSTWTLVTQTLVPDTTTSAAEFIISVGVAADVVIDDVSLAITGINEMTTQNNISIFPNPVSNVLNINNIENTDMIYVSNILGETVKTFYVTGTVAEINVSDLNDGIYFITLLNKNSIVATKKFSKQ